MGVDVQNEIEIQKPRWEVAAFSADPDTATAWYKNIHSVEWDTTPPLEVGSRFHFEARFLGRTLVYTYEVREYDPGERFTMATTEGPFPMQTTYTWEDAGEGTLMRLRNQGEPSGFAAVTAPMMQRAMNLANRSDLERLKEILEG